MYAIIESCGKQYKVAEGDVKKKKKLDAEEGKKVSFDKVILVSDDGKVQVGNPYVKGVKVEGKVVAFAELTFAIGQKCCYTDEKVSQGEYYA